MGRAVKPVRAKRTVKVEQAAELAGAENLMKIVGAAELFRCFLLCRKNFMFDMGNVCYMTLAH